MKLNEQWLIKMKNKINTYENSLILISNKIPSTFAKDLTLTTKRAAVFIPLCNRNGIPSLLFTVRSKTVGTHKGLYTYIDNRLTCNIDI